jgi:hypothetical protein
MLTSSVLQFCQKKTNIKIALISWFGFVLLLSKWIGPFAFLFPPLKYGSFGVYLQMSIIKERRTSGKDRFYSRCACF